MRERSRSSSSMAGARALPPASGVLVHSSANPVAIVIDTMTSVSLRTTGSAAAMMREGCDL